MASRRNGVNVAVDFDRLHDRIFCRIHRTGEEIKNDLPNALRIAIREKAWKHYVSPETGEPFVSLEEWLHHDLPDGLAVGMGRNAISYRDLMNLCRDCAPDVFEALKQCQPARHKRANGTPSNSANNPALRRNRRAKSGLADRLAREFPEIWEQYQIGRHKSITAAAIKAGIRKPSDDPLMRMKSYWRRADKRARKEFLEWINKSDS